MAAIADRTDPVRTWLAAAVVGVVAIAGASVAFPKAVYTNFVWRYFWGPIDADAHNAVCAIRANGMVERLGTADACQVAVSRGFTVAEPGYTFVSEAGYALVLLFMLAGVLLLVRRLGIGTDRRVVFALIPFVLFGGALRTVEDAADVVPASVATGIDYPASALIISPVIYVTVFLVTLVALLASLWLARRDIVGRYEDALAGFGTLALAVTVGYLGYLAATTEYLGFYPQMLVATIGIASAIAIGVYLAIDRLAPALNAGTGTIGLAILWAQGIDGVANVIASDWWNAIGLPFEYTAKHPVNELIVGFTELVVPHSVILVIGDSWPFLVVKIALSVGVIWLFEESIFEDSPRYAYLLMLAIIVVGLGPGTRDMLRATFGI
ncbi:DUF63 family protein [Halococcus sp. IIIV-5B]|uniref:DUF63 family protein n=1 Tax=Halococcus sp. IIIV-5B TaxID=2321230 RepID=UPI000E712528|nr:DUF63 family protein [Halococcus sp. IIIV-5B]RJT06124.1 DUF63 family protein [Halococcus sp. IIIV-5B]